VITRIRHSPFVTPFAPVDLARLVIEGDETPVTSRAAAGEIVFPNAPVSIRNSFAGNWFTLVGTRSMWPKRETGVYDFISGAT